MSPRADCAVQRKVLGCQNSGATPLQSKAGGHFPSPVTQGSLNQDIRPRSKLAHQCCSSHPSPRLQTSHTVPIPWAPRSQRQAGNPRTDASERTCLILGDAIEALVVALHAERATIVADVAERIEARLSGLDPSLAAPLPTPN